MQKIKLHIDRTSYIDKPTKDMGKISNRITNKVDVVDSKRLASFVENGNSFLLGTMNGKRSKKNFVSQQIVMLDFDNTETIVDQNGNKHRVQINDEDYLPISELLVDPFIRDNCSFIYKTFSYKKSWEKFRLVFILNRELNHVSEVDKVYDYLLAKYPTADISCKDVSRIFFGGRKDSVIVVNHLNTFSVDSILTNSNITYNNLSKFEAILNQSDKHIPITTHIDNVLSNISFENETDKKNWELLRDREFNQLKRIFEPFKITLHSKVQAVNYLSELHLGKILGLDKSPFIDIFHDETNPSGSIFKISNTNIWLYKCHSDSHAFTGDIIKVTQRLLGISYIDALEVLMDIFHIEIEVTEKIQLIREQCDLFTNILLSEKLPEVYPDIHKMFWRYKVDMKSILDIFKENIYEDTDGNIRSLTWISVRNLSQKMYGSPNKYNKVTDILNLLTYTNWIAKLSNEDIPKELLEKLLKNQSQSHNSKRSNVFELLLLDNNFFDVLNDFCQIKNNQGFTRKGFSYEYVLRTDGKDIADKVFVQDTTKKVDMNPPIVTSIHKAVLRDISERGYAIEKEIVEEIRVNYTKEYTEYKFKQIISELLISYDLVRVRMTKVLKKELGLDEKDKSMPTIIMKSPNN